MPSYLLSIMVYIPLAWEKRHILLVCEPNSLFAINLIKQGSIAFHPLSTIITSIRQLLRRNWVAPLQHTYREGNQCVDWLAKRGSSSDVSFMISDVCPSQFSACLLVDSICIHTDRSQFVLVSFFLFPPQKIKRENKISFKCLVLVSIKL